MPKLDIEKEHEVLRIIEDALEESLGRWIEGIDVSTWEAAKEILIYLKIRGYEVVKRGEA